MTMTHVIKLNDKVFTIESTPRSSENMRLTCPDGGSCFTPKALTYILHRDDQGRIQHEPILSK